ncbi:hypothetical protein H0194_07140 [Corynebacterium incognita]|uniref:Uncharacterized protein n=1 Tax=Corynebacterium incognita TaxID=2754725 RepID=A0A7G7CMP2_9CORY|nr:hypothetical protein [Corynebacterium incognita]QNE88858.1 hypothetical protein H0194_07140 [Corynebacterium incognita]
MGRLLLILLVLLAIYLVWKAFGPSSWAKNQPAEPEPRAIKGPDDDEEFLWNLEKERFKAEREKQRREQQARDKKHRDNPGEQSDEN